MRERLPRIRVKERAGTPSFRRSPPSPERRFVFSLCPNRRRTLTTDASASLMKGRASEDRRKHRYEAVPRSEVFVPPILFNRS